MLDRPVTVAATLADPPHDADLTLELAGGRVTVQSEVPGVLEWLREFLIPSISVCEREAVVDAPVVRVRARRAGIMLEQLTPIPWVALDSRVEYAPGVRASSAVTVQQAHWGVRQDVSATGVEIHPQRVGARVRLAAMRTVRELALARALRPEVVELHAGCVRCGGRSIVLAGPKRSGKTTLVSRLASSGAGLVANDRVVVRPSRGGWQVTGIPTIASVRRGTLRLLPDLFRAVPLVAHPVDLTLAEARRAARRGQIDRGGPLALSPALHAEQVHGHRVAGGTLAAIVVIGNDPRVPGFRLEPMSASQARAALPEVLFGHGGPVRPATVFAETFGLPGHFPSDGGPLADGAAWYRLSVGADLLASPAGGTRLLDALSTLG